MKSSPRKQGKSSRPIAAKNNSHKLPEPFPIVGIGASAGGLEAFSELLHNLPEKTGMAFVLVTHLDPKHISGLPEILARTTKLPVEEITDGCVVQPDHVYVIPANTNMLLKDGQLRLGARVIVHGQHMPIDNFFRSLAERVGQRAIELSCRARLRTAPRDAAPSRPPEDLPLPRMKSRPNTMGCRAMPSTPVASISS
jgi:two-component system CheB/CheR fusion protein